MRLSTEQQLALNKIKEWYDGPEKVFTLGGYAGTGKTTLANYLVDTLGKNIYFCALTGKAALALKNRGVKNAMTLHQLLYRPIPKSKQKMADLILRKGKGEDVSQEIIQEKINLASPIFEVNEQSALKTADLVVIDEYSMINSKQIKDILAFCPKILALGDPAQLQPVHGKSPLKPDFFLEQVHRQALGNGVLRIATEIRNGKSIKYGDYGDFKYIPMDEGVDWEVYKSAGQILVDRNKRRKRFNLRYRQRLERTSAFPELGDKLICLKNEHALEIYNGSIGTCVDIEEYGDDFQIGFEHNDNTTFNLSIWKDRFLDNDYPEDWQLAEYKHFDFGYAITVHKSQGSEWDDVIVVGKGDRSWLYTAITRAKKTCILIN